MNNKFVKILLVAFVFLFALVVIPYLKKEMGEGSENDGENKNISLNFSKLENDKVQKFVIKKGAEEKVFAKQEGKWQLNNSEIDEQKVGAFLKDLQKLRVKEMVSQNESNQNKFEVGRESATKLIIELSGKEETFLIGKSGASNGEFYMRKDGIKNVYLVASSLHDRLSWDSEKWKKEAEKK